MTFEYTRIPVKASSLEDSHRRLSQAVNYLLGLSSDYTDPLTTKGDVLGHDGTDSDRLAVGTNGQLLSADSAETLGLKWIDPPASSPLTTKGDVYTYDTDNQRLAVGTNGQVLTADPAEATGLKWTTPFSDPLTTKGDLMSRTAGATTRLGVGTNGQVLTADSAASHGIKWATPSSSSPLTTKGDLFGYDTADARIPIGTDGQVLTADSAQTLGLKWATPSGGGGGVEGGFVFQGTMNTTGTAQLGEITGLASTTTQIRILCQDISWASGTAIIQLQAGTTAGYGSFAFAGCTFYSDSTTNSSANKTTIDLYSDTAGTPEVDGYIELHKHPDSNDWVVWSSLAESQGGARIWQCWGTLTAGGTLDRLKIILSASTFDKGEAHVFALSPPSLTGWQHLATFNTYSTTKLGETTAIPSTATELKLVWDNVGFTSAGTKWFSVELGTGGTPTYQNCGGAVGSMVGTGVTSTTWAGGTLGLVWAETVAAAGASGIHHLSKLGSSDTWVLNGALSNRYTTGSASRHMDAAGSWQLGATLTALKVTIGSDSFAQGSVEVYWA